jgi:hypothetical protein
MTEEEIRNLSGPELIKSFGESLELERRASHTFLLHLAEIKRRKYYSDLGYGDMFTMLKSEFGLAETSISQRLKALELITAVPEVRESLLKGELNLSTLSQAQRQISRSEKVTGQKVAKKMKLQIVELIKNKTQAQTEIELMRVLPETASCPKVHERRISEDMTRVSLNLPDRLKGKLKRLQEIWAHKNPSFEYVELIEEAVDEALRQVDPVQRQRKRPARKSITSDEQKRDGPNKVEQKRGEPKSEGPKKDQAKRDEAKEQCATESVKRDVKVLNPLKSHFSGSKRKTYFPVETDRALFTQSQSQCEFVSPLTGRRCTSKFGLERDHIIPVAKGGTNDIGNLRLLCKTHNLLMARRHFGVGKVEREIRSRREKEKGDSLPEGMS